MNRQIFIILFVADKIIIFFKNTSYLYKKMDIFY